MQFQRDAAGRDGGSVKRQRVEARPPIGEYRSVGYRQEGYLAHGEEVPLQYPQGLG